MSFRDVIRRWTEERLLFLDKLGSGRIRYLLLASSSSAGSGSGDRSSDDGHDAASVGESDRSVQNDRSGGDDNDDEDDSGEGDSSSDGDCIPSFRVHEERADPLRLVHDFAVCALDNALYVTGGFSVSRMEHLARTLKFDPMAQSWSELRQMVRPRCKHGMTILSGGRILVAGGETTEGKITPSCEIYDPSTDMWSDFPRLPGPRCWMACAADGDDAYASGGYIGGRGRDDFWKYDAAAGRWTDVGSTLAARLPLPLDRHCMFVLGKYVYVLGGVGYATKPPRRGRAATGGGEGDTAIAAATADVAAVGTAEGQSGPAAPPRKFETQGSAFCLNLRTLESASAVASPSHPSPSAAARPIDADVSGGGDSAADEDEQRQKAIADDDDALTAASPVPPHAVKWIRLPDMSYARHSAGCVLLGDKVFVCGGTNAEFKCDVHPNELYDPVASEWRDEASLAAANIGNLACARLTYTHTQVVRRALPKAWPLW